MNFIKDSISYSAQLRCCDSSASESADMTGFLPCGELAFLRHKLLILKFILTMARYLLKNSGLLRQSLPDAQLTEASARPQGQEFRVCVQCRCGLSVVRCLCLHC